MKAPVTESLFNKVAGRASVTSLKKESLAQVFSRKFYETFKNRPAT